MKFGTAIVFLASMVSSATAFAPTKPALKRKVSLNIVVGDTAEDFAARVDAAFEEAIPIDPDFEEMVQGYFPGAMANQELVTNAVNALQAKGYNGENTLLCTSLCCDELARHLEDDFTKIFGNNFNLGGLAGFPFAGATGFGAMSAHIPDDGYCLVVYGPHVGVAADGTVGKVERSGIALVDTCCGSAVAASNYVDSILTGTKEIDIGIQGFIDFQQQGVRELILPHGLRLANAENRMVELPYALYESQDALLTEIVKAGSTGIKRGLAMLGGIQINTGPNTPDYFAPLKFDYINYRGEVTADLLPALNSTISRTQLQPHQISTPLDTGQNKSSFSVPATTPASKSGVPKSTASKSTNSPPPRKQTFEAKSSTPETKTISAKNDLPKTEASVPETTPTSKTGVVSSKSTTMPPPKKQTFEAKSSTPETKTISAKNDQSETEASVPETTPTSKTGVVSSKSTPILPSKKANPETKSISAKNDLPKTETLPNESTTVSKEEDTDLEIKNETQAKDSTDETNDEERIQTENPSVDDNHLSWITSSSTGTTNDAVTKENDADLETSDEPSPRKETINKNENVKTENPSVDDNHLSWITSSSTGTTNDAVTKENDADLQKSDEPSNNKEKLQYESPSIDDNHLSWITSSSTEPMVEKDQLFSITAAPEDQQSKYLLGKQIASAFETAEIDIVGVENESSIVLALVDSLLESIHKDEETNSGWNQLGADSLYSIQVENEADHEELQQDLLDSIGNLEDTKEDYFLDDAEITLVADSILNIICRDEDGGFEEITDQTPDDLPPATSHRFVLQPDGLLD